MADVQTVAARVTAVVVDQLGVMAEEVTLGANLRDDLCADSLDMIEIVMALEDLFGLELLDEHAPDCATVGALVAYVEQHRGR